MPKSSPQRKRMPLRTLCPNPLQHHFANTSTAEQDAALAADLRARGQQEPIQVMPPKNSASLPPYSVLDGHRRAAALQANGETEADVIIRHDLADADIKTIEGEFLNFNMKRRQLNPVDYVRLEQRLHVLQVGHSSGTLLPDEKAKFRDRIAKQLNMTSRNASRYVRLVQTPIEVQQAVRDGYLSLVAGEKVSDLNRSQQAEIAERIQAGESAKSVVAEFVGAGNGKHQRPVQALEAFAKSLRRGLDDLDGRLDRISDRAVDAHRSVLTAAHSVISKLLAIAKPEADSRKKLRKAADQCRNRTS